MPGLVIQGYSLHFQESDHSAHGARLLSFTSSPQPSPPEEERGRYKRRFGLVLRITDCLREDGLLLGAELHRGG